MNLAILFWFYKRFNVCRNRLCLLRKFNPQANIYGLFGGPADQASKAKEICGPQLDDFYACPFEDPNFKWKKGDLVLLDWYKSRGKNLPWDSIAIVQWDLLSLAPIKDLLPGIRKDQMFVTGLRDLDSQTEKEWSWSNRDSAVKRAEFLAFRKYLADTYCFEGNLLMCIFVFAVLPRVFFQHWETFSKPELGFLEYTLPSLASTFGIEMYSRYLGIELHDQENLPLNAEHRQISDDYIRRELDKPDGWRAFHPYELPWEPL
jgi:hypothetical protein